MKSHHFPLGLALLALMGVMPLPAARAQPPGTSLSQQVAETYKQMDTYHATAEVTMRRNGRWEMTRRGNMTVAFDRAGNRLAIDHPTARLVIDGGQLQARVHQFPGHHVQQEVSQPAQYEKVMDASAFLQFLQGAPPDVAMLMAAEPIAALSQGQSSDATPLNVDSQNHKGLQFETAQGEMTLHVSNQTQLIDKAVLQTAGPQMPGQNNSTTITIDYQVESRDEPLADERFAFDAEGSQPAGTLRELVQNAQGGSSAQSPGGDGSGAGSGHPLEGEDAPPVKLSRMDGGAFELAGASADVVVMDFWATWCPPCVKAMPKLQAVHDWAERENKSVAVYAVNVREEVDTAHQFMQKHELTMPVLMDRDGSVAKAYQANSIPQTVVVANGTVQQVHVGYSPNIEQTLKDEINELLEQ